MDETICRIAVAGDWHGNQKYALKAINYAKEQGAEVIVQVGDFGVWTPYGYIQTLGDAAERAGIVLMFIDGNHEDFDWLLSQPVDEDGIRRLHSHVWHLPRGFRWEWCGVRFLALGGAYSIDQQYRLPDISWWPQETITVSDMYSAIEGGEVDVMITHDCPDKVDIPLPGLTLPWEVQADADKHRNSLGMVVDEVNPKFLFHGHYHVNYIGVRESKTGRDCSIYGLDMDGNSFPKNIKMIDIPEMYAIL